MMKSVQLLILLLAFVVQPSCSKTSTLISHNRTSKLNRKMQSTPSHDFGSIRLLLDNTDQSAAKSYLKQKAKVEVYGTSDVHEDSKSHLRRRTQQKYGGYYTQQQRMPKGQKIGLSIAVIVTIILSMYACALRYELSTLNVYSLLGMQTDTAADEEERVGNAYVRNDGVEMS